MWHQPISKSIRNDENGTPGTQEEANEENGSDANANNETINSYNDIYDDAYNDDMVPAEDDANENYGEDDEYMVDYD